LELFQRSIALNMCAFMHRPGGHSSLIVLNGRAVAEPVAHR